MFLNHQIDVSAIHMSALSFCKGCVLPCLLLKMKEEEWKKKPKAEITSPRAVSDLLM